MTGITISAKPRCNCTDCFQNPTGRACELLTDHPSKQPCPFFKTHEQADIDRQIAHKKLADEGKYDLIKKYEYNPYRRGQW